MSHPLEAIQGISMLHNQDYFDKRLNVRMLQPTSGALKAPVVPRGLKTIGKGLEQLGVALPAVVGGNTQNSSFAPMSQGAMPSGSDDFRMNLTQMVSNFNESHQGRYADQRPHVASSENHHSIANKWDHQELSKTMARLKSEVTGKSNQDMAMTSNRSNRNNASTVRNWTDKTGETSGRMNAQVSGNHRAYERESKRSAAGAEYSAWENKEQHSWPNDLERNSNDFEGKRNYWGSASSSSKSGSKQSNSDNKKYGRNNKPDPKTNWNRMSQQSREWERGSDGNTSTTIGQNDTTTLHNRTQSSTLDGGYNRRDGKGIEKASRFGSMSSMLDYLNSNLSNNQNTKGSGSSQPGFANQNTGRMNSKSREAGVHQNTGDRSHSRFANSTGEVVANQTTAGNKSLGWGVDVRSLEERNPTALSDYLTSSQKSEGDNWKKNNSNRTQGSKKELSKTEQSSQFLSSMAGYYNSHQKRQDFYTNDANGSQSDYVNQSGYFSVPDKNVSTSNFGGQREPSFSSPTKGFSEGWPDSDTQPGPSSGWYSSSSKPSNTEGTAEGRTSDVIISNVSSNLFYCYN